jgi:hypothetical protein
MHKALRATTIGALFLAWSAAPVAAQVVQEKIDYGIIEQIRDEGLNRSQIEELGGYLTDVIGPRLTGSPGMKRANDWTASKLGEWGLQNVRVEPWGEFGRGWERVSYRGRFLEPFAQPLNAQPVAWTGSTKGLVTGNAVIVEASEVAELAQYKGKLKNAFVLMQAPAQIGPEFDPITRRTSLEELLANPWEIVPPTVAGQPQASREQQMERFRRMQEVRTELEKMARAEGAAAILNPSPWTYGILRVGGSNGRDPKQPTPLPTLVVSHEQYGQIWRNVKRGVPVKLEIEIKNRFYENDLKAYNTLADLPGTDKADEYVMLGAHLDSWHTGTGATDNAAGSIVMMEALRILKAVGVEPRRTIRIGLWSGEEQGLLGSRAWVKNNEALWPQISAYVNVDNGTGRLRGIWSQSNEKVIPIFEQILSPFKDLDVVVTRHGNTGGTDHLAFDAVGVPGFNFIQDPIEYSIRTHHSNADTFERLVIEDLKQAAVVVASTVYHLAMREGMMPRKPAASASN